MENVDNHPFPHGSVLKKFEGTVYHISGMQFRPTEIQTEQLHTGGIVRRDATFDAENIKTGEPVTLKLRAESDPTVYCEPSFVDSFRSLGLRTFWEEVHVFRQGTSSGYTPDHIADAELQQDDRYEYPGGYLGVLVLSKNPNRTVNIRDAIIEDELKKSDLKLLTKRWEEMFRKFRAQGLRLSADALEIEYEPDTKKPYVLLPDRFAEVEPAQPPQSDLYEMGGIENIIKMDFGEQAWRDIFGDISFQTRPGR